MPPSNRDKVSLPRLERVVTFLKDLGFVCLESTIPLSNPELTRKEELQKLREKVLQCKKCALWQSRTNPVFGEGDPQAKLVFIGEAPGKNEDLQGRPFVGPAGALLTHYIKKIGLSRDMVFITNIIKCRPPKNRDPLPEEISACEPYLIKQLELIQPKIICTLGRYAAQTLLRLDISISEMRGNIYYYHDIKVLPTFHPASLLYHPRNKELFEEDFYRLRKLYDESINAE